MEPLHRRSGGKTWNDFVRAAIAHVLPYKRIRSASSPIEGYFLAA